MNTDWTGAQRMVQGWVSNQVVDGAQLGVRQRGVKADLVLRSWGYSAVMSV